jgi:hypothetical protein
LAGILAPPASAQDIEQAIAFQRQRVAPGFADFAVDDDDVAFIFDDRHQACGWIARVARLATMRCCTSSGVWSKTAISPA